MNSPRQARETHGCWVVRIDFRNDVVNPSSVAESRMEIYAQRGGTGFQDRDIKSLGVQGVQAIGVVQIEHPRRGELLNGFHRG